jgi:probable phosphoglycerate mutase
VTTAPVILLARHGATAHSADGRFAGRLDVPLSDDGRRQGVALGAELAARKPATVLSSDLSRARDTAAEVGRAAGVPVHVDPRLGEEHLGRFQGRTRTEMERSDPDAYHRWAAGDVGAYAGREGLAAVGERALPAVLRTVPAGPLVVVTHANTAIALVGRLLGLPEEHWLAVGGLDPGHFCELRLDQGRWFLHRHNVTPTGEDPC